MVGGHGEKVPTPAELLGGFVIESFVALFVYGITVAQTYSYALHCDDDPWLYKAIVALVGIVETIHSFFVVHIIYGYTVKDFGHLERVAVITWSAGTSMMCAMLIVSMVQGFYIRRLFILSKRNWWLTLFASILLFARVSFGLVTAVLLYCLDNWGSFRTQTGPYTTVIVGLSLSVGVDVVVAASLVLFLREGRSEFSGTNHLSQSLIAYAVNTGLITMICSLVILVTFLSLKSSLVFAGFVQISSKLYANSLLGSLNARRVFRKMANSQAMGGPTVRSPIGSTPSQRVEIFREMAKVTNCDTLDHAYPPWRSLEEVERSPLKGAALVGGHTSP